MDENHLLRLLVRGTTKNQGWLATKCGVSEKHISQIVMGRAAMSPELATLIGSALGVDPAVLLHEQSLRQVRALREVA